jgi:hypothetical protein
MGLKILCAGFLIRHPLGGHTWHHLQYLLGLQRLGHEVFFFEDYGWPESCYDPGADVMTGDPSFGLGYMSEVFARFGLEDCWCYLAEDGLVHGRPREEFAQFCRECDCFLNLSNINWTTELGECRRRVLVDTDPVFTQIGALGAGGPFSNYHALFTYGENVHRPGCDMPTAGQRWLPTRQPVGLDAWKPRPLDSRAPFTTVMNWTAFGEQVWQGRVFGQKDREFAPYFDFPRTSGRPMEMAVSADPQVRRRLVDGGWRLADPCAVTRTCWTYQDYLRASLAEFCVAKHGYVVTQCGWFSDRSAGYLASGRPVVVQDTGFSRFFPCGLGLLTFRRPEEALRCLQLVADDPETHAQAARGLVEELFDSDKVLTELLERVL